MSKHVVIDPQNHDALWHEFQSRREQGFGPRRALRDALDALANLHPLVDIDPESEADVQRFADCVKRVSGHTPIGYVLQAALREFATPTPPKPDEPLGLGAVVEDADGELWVRFSSKTGMWWRNHQGQNARFDTLSAVKVLSPGVVEDE